MADLQYALLITQDERFRHLADLGYCYRDLAMHKLMLRLINLIDDKHLSLLAESRSVLGVDGYWLADADSTKRKLIKDAVRLHRKKGTPWAIREICRRLGFGEITLIEGLGGQIYDGKIKHDGIYMYSDHTAWAYYSIVFDRPIKNREARLLRDVLPEFAPARCVLMSLDYQNAPLQYDGKANFDGDYNFGVA